MTIAMKLVGEIPDAALTPLGGIGHYPQVEAPAETSRAILAFCRSHPH